MESEDLELGGRRTFIATQRLSANSSRIYSSPRTVLGYRGLDGTSVVEVRYFRLISYVAVADEHAWFTGVNVSNPTRAPETFYVSPGSYDWEKDAQGVYFMQEANKRGVEITAFVNSAPAPLTAGRASCNSNFVTGQSSHFPFDCFYYHASPELPGGSEILPLSNSFEASVDEL